MIIDGIMNISLTSFAHVSAFLLITYLELESFEHRLCVCLAFTKKFLNGSASLHPNQRYRRVPVASDLCQHLVFSVF